jgi:hypothetical protein
MKITIPVFLVVLLLFEMDIACKKNSVDSNTKGSSQLTLSKSSVKRGERLTASVNSVKPGSKIKWTIFPDAGSQLSPANSKAAAMFATGGSYRITASYYTLKDSLVAYDSISAPVSVNDSISSYPIYTPIDDGLDTASLEGDELTIIPASASDSGFLLWVKTKKMYNCTPYLVAYGGEWEDSKSLTLYKWGEVVEGSTDCAGVKNPAIGYLFYQPFKNGSYDVTVILNQITYHGAVTVTDSDYTFTWNYTGGVIISPLQIKKH